MPGSAIDIGHPGARPRKLGLPMFSAAPSSPPAPSDLGLGLDAGGTHTRWALAGPDGALLAEGQVAGISATQLAQAAGRMALTQTLHQLAAAVLLHGRPSRLVAGITGLAEPQGPVAQQLKDLLAQALGLAPRQMHCGSDMEIAYRSAFAAPGEGYLVYAGTGAIAAFIDQQGRFERAGGRGPILGDEGGGYWIAREALAAIWRQEDEQPGSTQGWPLAQALYAAIGGSDWASTRAFVYGADRGAVGRLALAVAAAAEHDARARALLRRAGHELARLALALLRRHGPRPVVAAGRALLLHESIAAGLREALPADLELRVQQLQAHHTAARLALLDRPKP